MEATELSSFLCPTWIPYWAQLCNLCSNLRFKSPSEKFFYHSKGWDEEATKDDGLLYRVTRERPRHERISRFSRSFGFGWIKGQSIGVEDFWIPDLLSLCQKMPPALDNDVQFHYLFVLVSCKFVLGHILGISYLKRRRRSRSRAMEKIFMESVLLTEVDRVEDRRRWINFFLKQEQEGVEWRTVSNLFSRGIFSVSNDKKSILWMSPIQFHLRIYTTRTGEGVKGIYINITSWSTIITYSDKDW